MKKIWIYLILTITILYSKTYPVLPLSIDAVFGNGVNRWEEEQFVNGLGHTLQMRGHIELMYDAPFVLTVRITDYKRPDPHRGTQHRYRLKTRIKAYSGLKTVELNGAYWQFRGEVEKKEQSKKIEALLSLLQSKMG